MPQNELSRDQQSNANYCASGVTYIDEMQIQLDLGQVNTLTGQQQSPTIAY